VAARSCAPSNGTNPLREKIHVNMTNVIAEDLE
jgi:hypothetical protein